MGRRYTSVPLALLLLLSLERQRYGTHASSSPLPALDSYSIDGNNHIFSAVRAGEQWELDRQEVQRRRLDGKSTKAATEHPRHNHGGGKHDAGPDGHHPKNSSKAGKASPAPSPVLPHHDPGTSFPTDSTVTATTTAATDASRWWSGSGSSSGKSGKVASSGSGKSGKADHDDYGGGYVSSDNTHEDDDWWGSGSGKSGKAYVEADDKAGKNSGKSGKTYGSGKSGKTISMSYDQDGWSTTTYHAKTGGNSGSGKSGKTAGGSSGSSSGKSGKADSWWSGSGSGSSGKSGKNAQGSSGKSGKAHDLGDIIKGDTKSGKDDMWSTTKPKAEKELTHYFIKETAWETAHKKEGAKSGKSASWDDETWSGSGSGKSGKAANDSSSGSWDSEGGWSGSDGAKASKSTDPTHPSLPEKTTTSTEAPDLPTAGTRPSNEPPSSVTTTPTAAAVTTTATTTTTTTATTTTTTTTTSTEETEPLPTAPPAGEGTPPTDLMTLVPTPVPSPISDSANTVPPVARAPPAPMTGEAESSSDADKMLRNDEDDDEEGRDYPTYFPTRPFPSPGDEDSKVPLLSQGQEVVVLQSFGLKLFADVAEPNFDEDTVTRVTMEHLIHSFRLNDWEASRLSLMQLEEERHLMHVPNAAAATSPATLRWLAQHPKYEMIFGGVLYFPNGAATPDENDVEDIIHASFRNERLEYYIELLREEELDIDKVKLDTKVDPPHNASDNGSEGDGFNWAGLMIGMSSAVGGIGLIAVGRRVYSRRRDRQLLIDDLKVDLENGSSYKDFAIRLQYTNDEIEAFPGSTVAMTDRDSEEHLSVPSLVMKREQEEIHFASTPGGNVSYSSSKSLNSDSVSPLESPQDIDQVSAASSSAATASSASRSSTSSTRYISVFTVKKDCGGKALEEVDLRALAIAYLSRMLKKFPNTHLLPYDKHAALPAITNIRNIPDDLEELQQYVGNARVDEKTGKVLFNLRVESDEPVSKMKNAGSRYKSSSPGNKIPPAPVGYTTVKSSDEMEQDEAPRSPGEFEDVKL